VLKQFQHLSDDLMFDGQLRQHRSASFWVTKHDQSPVSKNNLAAQRQIFKG
jgi:hypothetical protein